MIISDVAVWDHNNKKFMRLKECPKNGKSRVIKLNRPMREILLRRLKEMSPIPCRHKRESTGGPLNFVFQVNGEPVSYRAIQYHYNKALKKAGLDQDFSATQILRKVAANFVRDEFGEEKAQASGGWDSIEVMKKHYIEERPQELGQDVSNFLANLIEKNG